MREMRLHTYEARAYDVMSNVTTCNLGAEFNQMKGGTRILMKSTRSLMNI